MPKIRVSLSIGLANAEQIDILDINEDEWNECETDKERNDLMDSYWQDWSNNYIDGGYELIE